MPPRARLAFTVLLFTGALVACNSDLPPDPPAPPPAAVDRAFQAEAASLTGGASVATDAAAQAGGAVNLKANGDGVSVTLPDDFVAGTYTLGLVANAADVEGAPELAVTLDGAPAGRQVITSGAYAETPVEGALLNLKAGSVVNVNFINAYTLPAAVPAGSGASVRSARLDALHFTPATVAPPQKVDSSAAPAPALEVFKSRQDGLNYPSSINFTPNGDLLILERFTGGPGGEAVGPAKMLHIHMTTGKISTVTGMPVTADSPLKAGNGGAISLDVDPDFATNGRVFMCYTHATDATTGRANRASSLRLDLSADTLTNEQVIIDNVPSGPYYHNGCSVRLSPDGKLYMATGDADTSYDTGPLAQNPTSLAGKILRANLDGTVPSDNPTPGSFVWNIGHRNPQGLAFQPATNLLWGAEHGQNTRDELNLLLPGKNYGWPYCVGKQPYGTTFDDPDIYGGDPSVRFLVRDCKDQGDGVLTAANYVMAIEHFGHDPAQILMGSSMAPSNISFYTGARFPAWKNDILIAFLKASQIVHEHPEQINGAWTVTRETQVVTKDSTFNSNAQPLQSRLRMAVGGPDGYIYAITNLESQLGNGTNPRGSMIIRLRPK